MVAIIPYILIMWVCAGFGAWVLRRLRTSDATLAEELPFASAIGMGALAYLILGAGLLGHVELRAVLLELLVLAAISWRDMLRLAQRLPPAFARLAPWRQAPLPVVIFLLAVFLLTLIGALAPATDSDYDSLVYHLTMPKLCVRDGSIHPVPWLTHSNFPFTIEMLYTLGLLAHDQSLAKLFHFGCGWLTVIAIFGFARRWWGALAGWLGAAIFAAVPLIGWQMMTAYVELGLALYVFLAIAALARVADGQEQASARCGWLCVAALMCGWALGVKMLGGAVLIFALAALLWGLRSASRPRATQLAAFALIAAAIASPWYIKSYLWTGNPVYPFFYGLFGGRLWTAERARAYTEAQKAFGMGAGPLNFLLLPWNLTMHSRSFFDLPSTLRAFNVYVTVFGPGFLALLPTLALTGRVGPAGRLALWFALAFGVIWFLSTQNGRYLVPILPGLSACCGVAAARLFHRRGLVSSATGLALSLVLLSGLAPAYMLAAPAVRVALGEESQSDYLARVSATYHLFKQVEAATPPSARIMLLGDEPRTFYLDRDSLLGDHAEIFSRSDLSSGPPFLAALRRMGVTHLLLGSAVVQNMLSRSGLIETRLSDLAAADVIRPLAQYDSQTLWQIENRKG